MSNTPFPFDQNSPTPDDAWGMTPGTQHGAPHRRHHRGRGKRVFLWFLAFFAVLFLVVAIFRVDDSTKQATLDPAPAATAVQGEFSYEVTDTTADVTGPSPVSIAPSTPKAPKGVTVSGVYADTLQIRSFKPTRNTFGWFEADVRVKNLGTETLEYLTTDVTALNGETVIATGNGITETLRPGDTITINVIGADDINRLGKGVTYEVDFS